MIWHTEYFSRGIITWIIQMFLDCPKMYELIYGHDETLEEMLDFWGGKLIYPFFMYLLTTSFGVTFWLLG